MILLRQLQWLVVAALLLAAGPVYAQDEPEEAEAAQEFEDLEAFVDGIMAAQREAYQVAGAVVAVVQDGELVFSKGYGYADVEDEVPVDPARTLFRIGSTTKLFVWTAVMQLVEEGQIDLEADINEYLDAFQIPDGYGEPVTMGDLMAHAAGFEDRAVGLFARDPDRLQPLGELLAEDLPARVRPPGTLAAYSNHGVALAGYVIEQVTGTSWDDYVEEHILDPLGMDSSTAHQPVPEELAPNLSEGYAYVNGRFEARPFEYVPLAPAGAMSATANDMARFMMAHLQQGSLGGAEVLADSTARLMHERRFRQHEQVNGMAHGFIEQSFGGTRIIGHGGDTQLFHTELVLVPEDSLGLFVSYNSEEGGRPRSELVEAFLERYADGEATPPEPVAEADEEARERAEQVAGTYGSTRVSHTTLLKLAALASTASVRIEEDSTTLLVTGFGPDPTRWVEVEPYVYREREEGREQIVFERDARGQVTHLYRANLPVVAFTRLAFYETPTFTLALAGALAFIFLTAVVVWIYSLVRRKGQPGLPMLARFVAGAASLVFLTFLVLMAVALADPFEVAFGVPPLLRTALVVAIVGIVLAVFAIAFVVPVWRNRYWRPRSRLYYSLVALALLSFVWLLHFWNLIGFQY